MPSPIDLDHNATTQPAPEVVEVMARVLRDTYGNPGSRHQLGRLARQILDDSRATIATILGAYPEEVIFTSGGTEAINLALFGFAERIPAQGTRRSAELAPDSAPHILLPPGEHSATEESVKELEARGWRRLTLPIDGEGRLTSEQKAATVSERDKIGAHEQAFDLAHLPWSRIHVATVLLAHNETGVIQDVAPLAAACQTHGVPLHLDAVQAVGKVDVNFHALNCATLSCGAHKFHGPRGIGALLLRKGQKLIPQQVGGHQENGLRAGTIPVALVAGMAEALSLWQAQRTEITAKVSQLRDRLEAALQATCAPIVFNGCREHRLPNTLNVAFPGLDGEALLISLDLMGICCSLGSTCASGAAEPAPILVAMGKSPAEYNSSVRFSLGRDLTPEAIDDAAIRIAEVVNQLRAMME